MGARCVYSKVGFDNCILYQKKASLEGSLPIACGPTLPQEHCRYVPNPLYLA